MTASPPPSVAPPLTGSPVPSAAVLRKHVDPSLQQSPAAPPPPSLVHPTPATSSAGLTAKAKGNRAGAGSHSPAPPPVVVVSATATPPISTSSTAAVKSVSPSHVPHKSAAGIPARATDKVVRPAPSSSPHERSSTTAAHANPPPFKATGPLSASSRHRQTTATSSSSSANEEEDVAAAVGISTAAAWAERLQREFLFCDMCRRECEDPVHFAPRRAMVCRGCFYRKKLPSTSLQEIPQNLLDMIQAIQERARVLLHHHPPPSHPKAGRSTSPVLLGTSTEPQPLSSSSTSKLAAAIQEESSTAARPVEATTAPALASGIAPLGGNENDLEEAHVTLSVPAAPTAGGGTGVASSASLTMEDLTAASATVDSPKHVGRPLLEDTVQQLQEAEAQAREELVDTESKTLRVLKIRISKLIKIEADDMYDKNRYEIALQLWTEAIAFREDELAATGGADGPSASSTNSLSLLYGNRSAAYFMVLAYDKCCFDCERSIQYAKHEKVYKMCHRGARAAWVMGNLNWALEFLNKVPEKERSEEYEKVLTRCQKGQRILETAEKAFGTEEGDTCYRMLLSLFSDSYAFRLRFGEALMHRQKYEAAIHVLKAVPLHFRPPTFSRTLAECFYQSGFEFFKEAMETLKAPPMVLQDPACAHFLRQIQDVEDGKQEGNQAFKSRNFALAATSYTAAISKATGNRRILRILYCNRAAANKELSRFRESIEDCTKAIENDREFWKAYARRARCHLSLEDAFAAVEDFKKAIQFGGMKEDGGLEEELRDAEAQLKEECKRDKDYYYQLGVSKKATEREIKLKFRELSLRWHPDKCMSLSDTEKARAELKFKLINEAYSVLSDSQKRREYDYKTAMSSGFSRSNRTAGGYTHW